MMKMWGKFGKLKYCLYFCNQYHKKSMNMAAISTSDYHTSVRKIDTVDALWAIISSQPKKIRRALAERLQGELVNAQSKKTGLDKALDDVENGLVSGPFNSADELFKHLNV